MHAGEDASEDAVIPDANVSSGKSSSWIFRFKLIFSYSFYVKYTQNRFLPAACFFSAFGSLDFPTDTSTSERDVVNQAQGKWRLRDEFILYLTHIYSADE